MHVCCMYIYIYIYFEHFGIGPHGRRIRSGVVILLLLKNSVQLESSRKYFRNHIVNERVIIKRRWSTDKHRTAWDFQCGGVGSKHFPTHPNSSIKAKDFNFTQLSFSEKTFGTVENKFITNDFKAQLWAYAKVSKLIILEISKLTELVSVGLYSVGLTLLGHILNEIWNSY